MKQRALHNLDPSGGVAGQVAQLVDRGDGVLEWQPTDASGINSIVPGAGIDVDNTDPANPVVSVTGSGSGAGLVPLTTVIGGSPDLVWDADNQLVMTEAP